MYLNLPFRFLSILTRTKPINVVLNMGTLESLCDEINIDFWELDSFIKKEPLLSLQLLLYHGYISGCKELYKRPKYNKGHSMYWANNIGNIESGKLYSLITELFGKFEEQAENNKATEKKK